MEFTPSTNTPLDRIYSELSDLRGLIGRLENWAQEVSSPKSGVTLLAGVETIQDAITQTRGELTSLNEKENKNAQFNRAADELDAVVANTEAATDTILSSAEAIDDLAAKLQATASDEDIAKITEIRDNTIRIFEACNFQDITGQRISKVIGLMHFIEGRISTMAELWTDFGDVDHSETSKSGPHSFSRTSAGVAMHGPVLNGDVDVVSQDDIDSLFP
ncbi:protein phosphatase CheZ [Amorphus orientalis]|uniref:Chemotaxis protein CheZ n=1 Tax=Amorphus orientalis TaxID=649198 RepID=A0AAE4AWB6_9HYPH|nr:protein phosphatase CheZ [Amorphus orientalis]MDQ0317609.1 chemotaxis protein CheZ [Amorphus orientalis]